MPEPTPALMPQLRKPKISYGRHGRWMLDWPNPNGTTFRRAHYPTWQDAMNDCADLYRWRALVGIN